MTQRAGVAQHCWNKLFVEWIPRTGADSANFSYLFIFSPVKQVTLRHSQTLKCLWAHQRQVTYTSSWLELEKISTLLASQWCCTVNGYSLEWMTSSQLLWAGENLPLLGREGSFWWIYRSRCPGVLWPGKWQVAISVPRGGCDCMLSTVAKKKRLLTLN